MANNLEYMEKCITFVVKIKKMQNGDKQVLQ